MASGSLIGKRTFRWLNARLHRIAPWLIRGGLLGVFIMIPVIHVLSGAGRAAPPWLEPLRDETIVVLCFVAFEWLLSERSQDEVADDIEIADLPDIFGAALRSGTLSIDVVCYSAQTVVGPFGSLCQRLIHDRQHLSGLRLRLLLRDYDVRFVIPFGMDFRQDEDYNKNIKIRSVGFLDQIIGQADHLAERRFDIAHIEVTTRHYAIEPVFKAFIVNGSRVFWNLYPIQKFPFEQRWIWDYEGKDMRLMISRRNTTTAKVIGDWFSRIWGDGFSHAGVTATWQSGTRVPASSPVPVP